MFLFRVPTRVVKIVFHRGRSICFVTLLVLGSRFFCGNPPVFETLIATTLVFLFSRLITTYLPYQFRLLVKVRLLIIVEAYVLSLFVYVRQFPRCYHPCFSLNFRGRCTLLSGISHGCFGGFKFLRV